MDYVFGKLLGVGAGSQVYEYGPEKVCKLYINKYGVDLADREYKKTMDAYNHGLPVPKVYEIINVGSRYGLIIERVSGQTFNEVLFDTIKTCLFCNLPTQEVIDRVYTVFIKQVKDTAKFLYELHQKRCDLVETAKSALTDNCYNNQYLNNNEKSKIKAIIDKLPDGDSVCHGDPNPNNLFYSNNQILIIDWINCVKGHPFYDLAEYILMTEYADDPPSDLPDYLIKFYFETKGNIVDIFLEEYARLSNMKLDELECWIIPTLVSKMRGNHTNELQQRLLEGIRKGLSIL